MPTYETTFGPIDSSEFYKTACVDFIVDLFDPISSSELQAFDAAYEEFAKRDVRVLGIVNTHSLPAAIEFARTHTKKFPLRIAAAPKNAAVTENLSKRCVTIWTPNGQVGQYFPKNVGCNVQEILRIVDALLVCEEQKDVLIPANWKPGDPPMNPPPQDLRKIAGPDWYR